MRELKFRYWDSFNAEMLYSDGIGLENFFRCYQMAKNFDNNPILMQLTGLKDKNGKEIFEGDILRDGAVVEYFEHLAWDGGGSSHPGFYCKKWFCGDEELSYHDSFIGVEVVGNIYESMRTRDY
jgi:hypothetical protein